MNNCLKTAISISLIALYALSGMAETISRKEAAMLAREFFDMASGMTSGKPEMVYNGKNLTTDRLFSPFYVFNSPSGGFVIIAAENKAFPILGYSLKEKFNPNSIDKTSGKLLREFAMHIEAIRHDGRIPYDAIEAWNGFKEYAAGILDSTGNNGDYLSPDSVGNRLWLRHAATEFQNPGRAFTDSDDTGISDEEYTPFSFYEDFLAKTQAEKSAREKFFEELLHPSSPTVRHIGGGHFQITIPEEVILARILSIQGVLVETLTFKNTDTASISLDRLPPGYYVVVLNGRSGKPYGIKIYK